MKFFQRLITFCIAISVHSTVFGNAAQPGVFNAGGSGTLSLLFPEDSIGYKKVRMEKELVHILLYDGFAVVKGTYYMRNESTDSVNIRTGYPVNSPYYAGTAHSEGLEILFDSLTMLRVKVNGVSVNLLTQQFDENWYVWNTEYLPGELTVIEVTFIVNTSDSRTRQGYSSRESNGFVYVIETGAYWKPPIGNGTIRMGLRDNLNAKDIIGVYPENRFSWSEKNQELVWTFSNFIPTPSDNILITYKLKKTSFDFRSVVENSTKYFNEIEAFSKTPIPDNLTQENFGDPFEISGMGPVGWFFIIAIGVIVAILIGLSFLVKALIRRSKRS